MKTSDKVLIGILTGIILVVVVGFVIAFRWTEPEYRTENTPEAVAYNYVLALQKEDEFNAFQGLYSHGGKFPGTLAKFKMDQHWSPRIFDGSIEISFVSSNATNATVVVKVIRSDTGSFFNTEYTTNDYRVELRQKQNEWKILSFERCYQDCNE
jgi:hypothetical protein